MRTLLIEKAAAFPREKPCGGGLSSRALTRFPYLKEVFGEIGVNSIRRVYLESPDGNSVLHEQAEPLMHLVRRWEFDAALFRRAAAMVAVEAGVTDFWRKYVGLDGDVVGIDTFGASAPAEALFPHFGFTVEHVVAAVKALG